MRNQPSETRRSMRRHLIVVATTAALLVGGVGIMGASTEISGAVIATGSLVVESNVKKVQHASGGIVGELLVHEGKRVRAGDILLRLDETAPRANLSAIIKNLWELSTRQARLEAERDGAERPSFAQQTTDDPDLARIVTGEQKLFDLRRSALSGQRAQLRERIAQLRDEARGLQDQAAAKAREIELVNHELKGVRELWEKNLIQLTRLTALERDAARLDGERGALVAAAAQTNGKIAEVELQILQLDQNMRSEVAKELADIRAKTAELVERKITASDELERIDVRAPISGFVHQLAVHTQGGVVTAGEQLMLIVPEADDLIVEVRVSPHDVDQIKLGQPAALRFSTFNQRTTPELNGTVTRIAADVIEDQRTGLTYYRVRIALQPGEMARLEGLKLTPGMPVDAFIRTVDRTMLSYLFRPLADQASRAFREK